MRGLMRMVLIVFLLHIGVPSARTPARIVAGLRLIHSRWTPAMVPPFSNRWS